MVLFFKRFRVINVILHYCLDYKWVLGLVCMSCLLDAKAQSPNLSGKAQRVYCQNSPVDLANIGLLSFADSDSIGSVVSPVILPSEKKRAATVKSTESDRGVSTEKTRTSNLANGVDAVLGIGAMAISGLEMQSVAGHGSSLLPVVVGQIADQSKRSKK
jgi:hypothetical protein